MNSVFHPLIGESGTILIKIVLLLVAIAYFTIAERKIMGSIQRRRGPNVVGAWGLLQPAADGLKLIAKEIVVPGHANSRIFVLAPLVVLTLSLLSWSIIPFNLTDWSLFSSLSDFYSSTSRQENGPVKNPLPKNDPVNTIKLEGLLTGASTVIICWIIGLSAPSIIVGGLSAGFIYILITPVIVPVVIEKVTHELAPDSTNVVIDISSWANVATNTPFRSLLSLNIGIILGVIFVHWYLPKRQTKINTLVAAEITKEMVNLEAAQTTENETAFKVVVAVSALAPINEANNFDAWAELGANRPFICLLTAIIGFILGGVFFNSDTCRKVFLTPLQPPTSAIHRVTPRVTTVYAAHPKYKRTLPRIPEKNAPNLVRGRNSWAAPVLQKLAIATTQSCYSESLKCLSTKVSFIRNTALHKFDPSANLPVRRCATPDFLDFKLITESDDIGDVNYGLLAILALSSLSVYGLIISGWASNSKYAFLGALRSAAQRISYEVAISLVLLPIVARAVTLNFTEIASAQKNTVWFIAPLLPAAQVYFISRIAETNRTPFDLPEAEAELVAGYNIDYSSIIFARFFLAEYGNIIRMSLQKTLLFLGGWAADDVVFTSSPLVFALKGLIFCFLFVLVRATFPRYRYDQLIDLGWKIFLPVATGFLVQTIGCLFSVDGLPIAQQSYYVDYTE